MSRRYKSSSNNTVAAIGIGAMIVFIAMVLVAGIAASVLIQTAGTLERQGMTTGAQTTAEVATGLKVVDIEGQYTTRIQGLNATTGLHWNISGRDDGTPVGGGGTRYKTYRNYTRIHNMTLTITPRAGSADIDISQVILEISNSTTKCLLTYDSSNYEHMPGDNGVFNTNAFDLAPDKFGIIKLEDADGSCTSTTPVINRGDMIMLSVNVSACFWGLSERDDVWGMVSPEEGSAAQFAFRIPASLSDVVYDMF